MKNENPKIRSLCVSLLVLGACGAEGVELQQATPETQQAQTFTSSACGGRLSVFARTWREGTTCRAAIGARYAGILSPPPRVDAGGWACVNDQCAYLQWNHREVNGVWWDYHAEAPAIANCWRMTSASWAAINAPGFCPPGDSRTAASESQ